jgi:hypothetical protein
LGTGRLANVQIQRPEVVQSLRQADIGNARPGFPDLNRTAVQPFSFPVVCLVLFVSSII